MSNFSRRTFVGAAGATSLFGAHAGLTRSARSEVTTPERQLMQEIHQEFQEARKTKPWTLGLANPDSSHFDTKEVRVEGKWPQALKGIFYRTGPAQHERAGERYAHWFDGDGMAHAWHIGDGRVAHKARMIKTPKYMAEEKAGRFLRPAFGTAVDNEAAIASADGMNVGNINMLRLGDEVLALWEGGSSIALDPDSLETKGFKVFSEETKGLPFSAHHKIDPDGTIWNFGVANSIGKLILYHISRDGKLLNVVAHDHDPNGMVHDFLVTEKNLIVLVPPLYQDQMRAPYIDSFSWHAGEASHGFIFDKETLSLQRRFELPGDFHFHFGNAWEEMDGTLRFDYCATPDADFVMNGGRAIMRGDYSEEEEGPSLHYEVRVPIKGEPSRTLLGDAAEFPRTDPRLVGKRHRFIYTMWQLQAAGSPFFRGIAQVDLALSRRVTFDYGAGFAAEEHCFVPRPGSVDDSDGWVLGTVLDLGTGRTSLNVLDAANVSAGPIARAHLDYGFPMGLHGAFHQTS